MNYLTYHQSGEGQLPNVPDGLKQLMTDISREVLREQPENIYEFIANYLEEMEIAREHKGIAENVLDTVIDESVTVIELFKENGISLENAEKSAQIIENYFNEYAKSKKVKPADQQKATKSAEKLLERDVCRQIMQSCDLTREQDQKLRKIVQMCFKNFYFREKTYKCKLTRLPDAHWANHAEKTLDIYRRSAPEKCKLDRAAVVIQSAYRSYFVRKMPKEIQRFHECATKIQTRFRGYIAQKRLEEAIAAAIKIQALYRGYSVRKRLLIQREMEGMENQPFLLVSEIVEDIVADSIFDEDEEVESDSNDTDEKVKAVGEATLKVKFDCTSEEDIAARTIQKVFRGFQARKKASNNIDNKSLHQKRAQKKYDYREIKEEILNVIGTIQESIHCE